MRDLMVIPLVCVDFIRLRIAIIWVAVPFILARIVVVTSPVRLIRAFDFMTDDWVAVTP